MLNIAIVDDDESDAQALAEMINRYYDGDSSRYSLTCYSGGDSFLASYRANNNVVFLDIDMPGTNGMDVARRLRTIDQNIIVIFTTRFAQYATAGYDVDAIGYLLKPLDYYAVLLKIRKAESLVSAHRNVTIPLSMNNEIRFLSSQDVLYVEVRRHDIFYHTRTDCWKVRGSLTQAAQMLEPAGFVACSRFFLVNLAWVSSVNDNSVCVGEATLPVSRSKKQSLMQALTCYYGR